MKKSTQFALLLPLPTTTTTATLVSVPISPSQTVQQTNAPDANNEMVAGF